MNNGAFGENFPYSNFHDLNMDWIIKIAKDFLDQYTHIQEIIANGEESLTNLTNSGLEQLQDKADALEELLQQWYNTHSEDIANQLADALSDLNDWYTTHEGYLNQYLTNSITAFNNAAERKAAETIATIPADYSQLSASVNNQEVNKLSKYEYENNIQFTHTTLTTGYMTMNGNVQDIYRGAYTPILTRQEIKNAVLDPTVSVRYAFFDENDTYIGSFYNPNIESQTYAKVRAFFYPTRTGGTEDATDAEIILIHATTKIVSRNILSNIPSEVETLKNTSVSRNEIENNIKYTNTSLTIGYMTLNGNTQDLYRGAYTPLLTFQQVKTAITDPSIGVRYALFDENNTFIASYYNPTIEQDFAYARAFFYPNRTGGNTEATEAEMNLILSTSKIVSREPLLIRPPYIIVAQDGSGDYTTINDAVANATDGTTIFIKDGEYKETVVINHYIHLVGESKYGTILYQNIGTYENAPLLITQGSVSNMTIYSKRPDSGEYDARAYAIHLDGIFASETKYQKCEIFNCIIKSEVHDAIGAGSNGQQVYDIHDNFIIVEQNAVTGACGLKLHNGRNQVSGIIKLANNIILSSKANGTSAYDILFHNSEPNVNQISLQMTNNVLRYYRNLDTSIFVPATYCYGNSVPEMNRL